MSAGGQIITFYSYKGGVGRSMALANIAALLSQQGKKVLVIDLDLEAPGLHRYFPDPLVGDRSGGTENAAGAIELLTDLRDRLEALSEAPTLDLVRRVVASLLDEPRFFHKVLIKNPNVPASSRPTSLSFIPAGRFDPAYPERVHAFDWQRFYAQFGDVFPVLAEDLKGRYDFVLLDSRTGITDIGSICTVLLPDKLVLAFSPNQQSLQGAGEIARQAALQRRLYAPSLPLLLFPLPGRLENAEKALQQDWLERARHLFEKVFHEVHEGRKFDLTAYFNLVRIQHSSFYAYGEKIAAEEEPAGATGSMAAAFRQFLTCLLSDTAEEMMGVAATAVGTSATKTAAAYLELRDAILGQHPSLRGRLLDYLTLFDTSVESIEVAPGPGEHVDDEVVQRIEQLTPYRNEFVEIIELLSKYVADEALITEPLVEFLQSLLRLQGRYHTARPASYWHESWSDHFRFFLNELFIYLIAALLKGRRFALAAALLENPYYQQLNGAAAFHSYTVFQSFMASLNKGRNERLHEGRRLSVVADLMKDRAHLPGCSFEDLQQADFVLFFNSILHDLDPGMWYPQTLIDDRHRPFKLFSMAESRKYFADLQVLFRVRDVSELKERYQAGKARLHLQDRWRLGRGHTEIRIAVLANLDRLASDGPGGGA